MPIEFTYAWDGETNTITFADEDVTQLSQRYGWRPNIPDPNHARAVELKQSEALAADPNSPERQALMVELQSLQQQGGSEIPNPQTANDFAVEYVSNLLQDLLLDKQSIQAAAQEKANADMAAAKAAIKTKYNFKK